MMIGVSCASRRAAATEAVRAAGLLVPNLAAARWIVHYAKGFGVSAGGCEYVLMWGIITFAIALRGGGPYSLDRVIGKEL